MKQTEHYPFLFWQKIFGKKFLVYSNKDLHIWNFPLYQMPEISFSVLTAGQLNESSFSKMQKVFKQHFKGEFQSKPYINFFYKTKNELSPVKRNLAQFGMKYQSTKHLNLFKNLRPTNLPKGLHFKYGDYKDKNLFNDYVEVQEQAFPGTGKEFAHINIKAINLLGLPTQTLIVYNSRGRPIGSGAVFIHPKNKVGWLFGGSVIKDYRSRGIWTSIVGLRQALTLQYGLNEWVLFTETPEIMNKCDETSKIALFF